jgi:NAD(P)H-dependent FMN reductase
VHDDARVEEETMTKIVGISGSLRRGSFNSALLRAAAGRMPAGATLDVRSIEGIPLYNGDLEAEQGAPPAVVALKDALAAADGLLLATPEYNNAMPGVLKNAIDWISRPMSDTGRVFGGLAVGVVGATPGGGGTVLAQISWLPVIRALGLRPWFGGALYVRAAHKAFDDQGQLVDDDISDRLTDYLAGLVAFAQPGRG